MESIYVDEEPAGGADASASPAAHPPRHVSSDSDDEEELEDLGLSAEAIEAALAKFQDGESDSTGGSTVSSSRRTSLTSSPPPDSDDMETESFFSRGGGGVGAPTDLTVTASTATVVQTQPSFQLPTASSAGALRVYANMDRYNTFLNQK